jgi:hypothetical protein
VEKMLTPIQWFLKIGSEFFWRLHMSLSFSPNYFISPLSRPIDFSHQKRKPAKAVKKHGFIFVFMCIMRTCVDEYITRHLSKSFFRGAVVDLSEQKARAMASSIGHKNHPRQPIFLTASIWKHHATTFLWTFQLQSWPFQIRLPLTKFYRIGSIAQRRIRKMILPNFSNTPHF